MSVTIIIPICGDLDHWRPLAQRARWSAEAQTVPADAVVISEAELLSDARNEAAAEADTEWLCFLDADDELDVGYVEAMLAGTGDVRQPSTLGVVGEREDPAPVLIPAKPLLDGNYIVIGAFVRRVFFEKVGGFRELPAYEDWDLWIRCWQAGAEIEPCPDAIYRVHVNPSGRNALTRAAAIRAYYQVRTTYTGRTQEIR